MEKPRSLRPSPEAVRDWGKWLITSTISVVAALITTLKWVDKHATDDEVRDAVADHDRDAAAHHDLADRVIKQAEASREMAERLARAEEAARHDHEAVYWAWWVMVGDKAAELERDGRKRQLAAVEARDRYDAYFRQGMSPQEAFRRALRTPLP